MAFDKFLASDSIRKDNNRINKLRFIKKMIIRTIIIGFFFFQIASYAQNYDAELLSQKTEINVSNGKLIKSFFFEIKINNKAGEKYSKVTIPYSKLNKIKKIDALIKDSRGIIVRKLRKDEIIEKSAISSFSFYDDDFVKEFTLRHNTFPYTIIYSYQSQQDEFLYLDYWIPVLDVNIPTHDARLNVSVNKDYKISFSNHNINAPKIEVTEFDVQYTWQADYTKVFDPEILSPPIIYFMPSVAIVPWNFNFEMKGSFENWSSFGNWQYNLIRELNELPEIEKRRILARVVNIQDDKEKVKVLYHFLQDETRYINISIETGGLKPYPASYVAENKYGDCKALTNYFKSILDFIGIKSYYTKIYAGSPIRDIDKSFPSQQFNHIILYVPLKNGTLWLDCTADGAFNYLGTFTQNRDVLIIDKNNSCFLRTPELMPADVLETRKIIISYKQDGKSNVSFQNEYRGEMFERLLNIEKSFSESDKLRILRNYVIENEFDLIDYRFHIIHRDSLQMQLLYDALTRNIYKQFDNTILVSNIPFSLPHFEKPENRKLPVQIDYPIYKIDTLTYEIPLGFSLSNSLVNKSITTSYGQYSLEFLEKENSIQVVKSVLIKSGIYPLNEYEDFQRYIEEIHEIENKAHITISR